MQVAVDAQSGSESNPAIARLNVVGQRQACTSLPANSPMAARRDTAGLATDPNPEQQGIAVTADWRVYHIERGNSVGILPAVAHGADARGA